MGITPAGKNYDEASEYGSKTAAGSKLRENSVPPISKFNGNKAIETRHRLFNRNINKYNELETRDNLNGKLPNHQNEAT